MFKLFVKVNFSILLEELNLSDTLSSVKNIAFNAKSHPNINFKRDNLIASGSKGEL